jgi:DNA-binding MarR family transcriptional regulator
MVAHHLFSCTLLVMRSVSAAMRQNRLQVAPAHIGILSRLEHGPCSLTELAQIQLVRLPTISRTVALLMKRGWIRRRAIVGDQRQSTLLLTPGGQRLLIKMRRQAERHIAHMLRSVASSQRATLGRSLATLMTALALGADA